jgi:hypothetical protein
MTERRQSVSHRTLQLPAGRSQLELSDLVERFQTLGSRILGIREGNSVRRHGEAGLSHGLRG